MRNGFLPAALVTLILAGTAHAQPPAYYPHYPPGMYQQPTHYPPAMMRPYYPPMPYPGAGGPRVMMGGALTANGKINIPSWRDQRPMSQAVLQAAFQRYHRPRPMYVPPRPSYYPPASIQRTSMSTSVANQPRPALPAPFQNPLGDSAPQPGNGSGGTEPLPMPIPTPSPDAGSATNPTPVPGNVLPPSPPTNGNTTRPVPHGHVTVPQPSHPLPAQPHYAMPHPQMPCPDCEPAPCCTTPSRPCPEPTPPYRVPEGYCMYGGVEYMYWWIDEQPIPQLLLVGPPTNLAVVGGGIVPGDDGDRHGGRAFVGVWLNPSHTVGLEVRGFYIQQEDGRAVFTAGPNRNVIRVGSGGQLLNQASIDSSLELWGTEAQLRCQWVRGRRGHLDVLGGFRHINMDEVLRVTTQGTVNGANTLVADTFKTENGFYGPFLGLDAEFRCGRFFLNTWGKCALGYNRQEVNVSGHTLIGNGFQPVGSLARASNSGDLDTNELTVVPEFGIRGGIIITDNCRFSAGYNFLHISSVARPGDQIDNTVTPFGPAQPASLLRGRSFEAHGLVAEFEFRF